MMMMERGALPRAARRMWQLAMLLMTAAALMQSVPGGLALADDGGAEVRGAPRDKSGPDVGARRRTQPHAQQEQHLQRQPRYRSQQAKECPARRSEAEAAQQQQQQHRPKHSR